MVNSEKLKEVFSKALGIEKEKVTDNLEYNSIPEWDSVAHMTLIGEIEEEYDLMLDTDDIIDMSSVSKATEILEKYNVER